MTDSVFKSSRLTMFIAVCLLAATIVAFITCGYPRPHDDDLAVTGAAVSLANGEGFNNPWIKNWLDAFPADKPYVYPPGFQYTLAAWLHLFGIGASSMIAFQWANILIGAGAIAWFFSKRCKVPLEISLVAAWAYILMMQTQGMRPEILSYMSGFLGLSASLSDRKFLKLCGYFLLVFSGLVYPVTPIILFPLYLFAWDLRLAPNAFFSKRNLLAVLREVPYALAALLVVGALFHLMINGEVSEFFRVFSIHRKMAAPSNPVTAINEFIVLTTSGSQKFTRTPLMLAAAGVWLLTTLGGGTNRDSKWRLLSSLAIASVLYVLLNPLRARPFVPLLMVLMVMVGLHARRFMPVVATCLTGVGLVAITSFLPLLSLFLQQPVDTRSAAAARLKVEDIQNKDTSIMVDSWSARYVFDYNLPPGSIDLTTWTIMPRFQGPYPPRSLEISEKPSNEIWILGSASLATMGESKSNASLPRVGRASVFGKNIGSITKSRSAFWVIE